MYPTRLNQNLSSFNTLIFESGSTSTYFGIDSVPTELTAGKNLFKIAGTNLLHSDTPLKIEAVDSTGTVLYTDITSYIDKAFRRVISIWVTPNVTKGIVKLTVMGEVHTLLDGTPIPTEWREKYNAKWEYQLPVDPTKPNITEILFETTPRVFFSGFKTVGKEISPLSVTFRQEFLTQSNSTVSFDTINNSTFYGQNDQQIQSSLYKQSSIWSQIGDNQTNETATTVISRLNKQRKQSLSIINGVENIVPNYKYRLTADADIFVPNMIGGIINIPTPNNVLPSTESYSLAPGCDSMLTAQISDVLNSRIAYVNKPLSYDLIKSRQLINHKITHFDSSNYCISYSFSNSDVQYLTSSAVPNIVINMIVGGLDPITGDISTIKVSAKRRNEDVTYQQIFNGQIQPEELLVDPFYPNQTTFKDVDHNKRMNGLFFVTSDLTKYWQTSSYGLDPQVRPFVVNHKSCSAAVQCFPFTLTSGSVNVNQFDPHTILRYSSSFSCLEGNKYAIRFRAMGCYDLQSNSYPNIEIYMSGSSFLPNNKTQGTQWGKFIGQIILSESKRLYPEVELPAIADRDGDGTIIFKIKGGQWFLTNISVKPYEEYGFTPNNFQMQIALPYDISSSVDFKLEYFDNSGRQAEYITYVNNFILKTKYYSKQYINQNGELVPNKELYTPDSRIAPNTDILHQYNLHRNLITTDGIIEAMKKSDIYTREAYILLLSNNSSSRYNVADDAPEVPPQD